MKECVVQNVRILRHVNLNAFQVADDASEDSGVSSASQCMIGSLVAQNLVRRYPTLFHWLPARSLSLSLHPYFYSLPSTACCVVHRVFTNKLTYVNAGVLAYLIYRCFK